MIKSNNTKIKYYKPTIFIRYTYHGKYINESGIEWSGAPLMWCASPTLLKLWLWRAVYAYALALLRQQANAWREASASSPPFPNYPLLFIDSKYPILHYLLWYIAMECLCYDIMTSSKESILIVKVCGFTYQSFNTCFSIPALVNLR